MTVQDAPPATESQPAPPTATGPRSQSWLVTPLAIVLALLIGELMIVFSDEVVRADLANFGQAPGDFFADAWYTMRDATLALLQGAVFDPSSSATLAEAFGPVLRSLYTATPLILAGLAVSVAFRAGLFNIGAEGQVIVGAFASGAIGLGVDLPAVIHLPLAVAGGVAAGALWGSIAGFLKARSGAHEVITTIMLNYVASFGLVYLLATRAIVDPDNPQASRPIAGTARLPHLVGSSSPLDAGLLLAVAAAALVWWIFTRTTVGFRLRSVGFNPAAARTAGIDVGRQTVLAMAFAGSLAGLAGTALALGGATSYVLTPNISSNVGFDAISVALLGRSRPWAVVAAGLLFGALRQGGARMQADAALQAPIDVVTVVQALIVVFIAAPALVRAVFRWKRLAGPSLPSVTSLVTAAPAAARSVARHLTSGGALVVLGLLVVVALGTSTRAGGTSRLQFSLPGAAVDLGGAAFTARPVVIGLGLVALAAGAARMLTPVRPRIPVLTGVAAIVAAVVVWSIAGSPTGLNIVSLLSGGVFPAAIPLVLGAMAGVISERAGIVNIAIEGKLLMGAFVASVTATLSGSIWFGVLGGMAAGALMAALLAVLAIRYLVDQAIIGMVLNVFAVGVTGFLYTKLVSADPGTYNAPGFFPIIRIPFLSDIPVIGPALFSGTIFLYLTAAVVVAVHVALFRTRWGLRVRAVGEHPRAADAAGIDVRRVRFRAVLIGGLIAGLGGAFLVLGTGNPGSFQLDMSAGKGFIALAAVVFAGWRPLPAVLAALLFGFADQLQSLLAQAGSPIDSNLLLTLPYVVTLFAVAGFVGRKQAPAASGRPYDPLR